MSDLTLDSLLNSIADTDTTIEKAASESTVTSVADQLKDTLTKEASDASTIGEDNMSVQTGNAIADSILGMLDGMNKEAAHGEGGGNKVVTDLNEMEAQHAARIEQTPRQGKTITEVAKALQEREGGEKSDTVSANDAAPEGNSEAAVAAVPSDIEKSAAVDELISEGYYFEDAIEMVKQASEEMEYEADELEKSAAVNVLISEGVEFDDAVLLVKQASEEMSGYSDLEKAAALEELMCDDGLKFEEAAELIKQASFAGK